MDSDEARRLVETEGFSVISLQEEKGDVFIFLCNDDDESEIEVAVIDGNVIVAPT